jgi:hypothetical protein
VILWLLRLFRPFRDLESIHAEKIEAEETLLTCQQRVRELEQENTRLLDRIEFAQEDRQHLWTLVRESLGNERAALMSQVNEHWQKQYGVTPYPEQPHLPENQQADPRKLGGAGRPIRMTASQVVAQAEEAYWTNKARQQEEASKRTEVTAA